MEDMNMTEMVTEQAADVAAAETTNCNLGATIATTVGIGLAGYGIGKLIEKGVKWAKSKIQNRKAKVEAIEAQPVEVIEAEIVD